MVGQIENVAQNPQQILVQQAPGGNPGASLQDMLQLPAYPTDDGVLLCGTCCSSAWHTAADLDVLSLAGWCRALRPWSTLLLVECATRCRV